MSGMSKIQWTDRTWNPTRGCARVSEGCRNCYAERVAHRFSGIGRPYDGLTEMHTGRWTGKVRLVPEALEAPLRWRKPSRIFVDSMSDLFHEDVPEDFIFRVFQTMGAAHQHTYQILTKRPAKMLEVLPRISERLHAEGRAHLADWRHVWLGVSVEDQATADERIPLLLQTPVTVRFLSVEPLLAPVDLREGWRHGGCSACRFTGYVDAGDIGEVQCRCCVRHARDSTYAKLDWVIVGGESGPGARPCDLAWIRSIVAQCKAAEVPVFVKQLGKWISGVDHLDFIVHRWNLGDRIFIPPIIGPHTRRRPPAAIAFGLGDQKGGNINEWPADIRVREWPVFS